MDDTKIVALYFERNEAAIEETAAKYGKYCFVIAQNILDNRSDAEETVNDTYMGAWRSIPPHRPVQLSTYLGKLTRRLALMRYRKYTAQKRGCGETALALEELADCISDSQSPERAVEIRELSFSMKAFVAELPETERKVFLCRYWYLYPVRTIARQFGFTQSKTKSMLSRTRSKLRSYLQKEGFFE